MKGTTFSQEEKVPSNMETYATELTAAVAAKGRWVRALLRRCLRWQRLGNLSLDIFCPRHRAQTRMRNFWSNFLTHPGGFRPSQKVGTKLFCFGVVVYSEHMCVYSFQVVYMAVMLVVSIQDVTRLGDLPSSTSQGESKQKQSARDLPGNGSANVGPTF